MSARTLESARAILAAAEIASTFPWTMEDDGDDYVISAPEAAAEVARVHHAEGAELDAEYIVVAANEAPGVARDYIGAAEAIAGLAAAARSERECEARVGKATTECERLLSSRSRAAFDRAKADLAEAEAVLADARRVLRERLDALLANGGAR